MYISSFSVKNKTSILILSLFIALGGYLSYQKLGRLEDPEFTIKTAVVITRYPGATPYEVENEVTEKVETAIQQLKQIDKVRSISLSGMSIIYADFKDKYNKDTIPQVWDDLRKKISDMQSTLPPGSKPPIVNDDFADVYGVFYALTGDGYSYEELSDYADKLRKELLLCQDVAKVDISGEQIEAIFVEISRSRLAQLGIPPQLIFNSLNQQNIVSQSGMVRVSDEYLNIRTSGAFTDADDIGDLLIQGGALNKLFYLKDIATIRKGYVEPAQSYIRYNGEKALGIGVSTVPGGNVVVMGEAVKKRIEEIKSEMPLGMELNVISLQSDTVQKAVDGFVLNLFEAVAIVIVLLMIFMGWREGVLIGIVLLLTILATFIFMRVMNVSLQRISLGALIIALGMLVDNAIVVAEGIVINLEKGLSKIDAAGKTVRDTKWPLLGATIIAILAFAAISLSNDASGEFLGSLFKVIAVSLLLSWVFAVTVTPVLCVMLLSESDGEGEVHNNLFFRIYRFLLALCIRFRILFIISLIGVLFVSFYGFTKVEKSFFPDSSREQFLVDVWMPKGTHIDVTSARLAEIEKFIKSDERVKATTSFIGKGATRFILTYSPEDLDSSYGQILVTAKDYSSLDSLVSKVKTHMDATYTDMEKKVSIFRLGPGSGSKIEARFSGPDIKMLRDLADKAKSIMSANPNSKMVKDNWREKTKIILAKQAVASAKNAGISRAEINAALAMTYNGVVSGVFRENDDLLPIIVRPPAEERIGVKQLNNIQVFSSVTGKFVPIEQVVSETAVGWEDPIVRRRNRKRTITAQCDPKVGNASVLFGEIRKEIEAIQLPPGYEFEWGGEFENSQRAQRKLMANVPLAFAAMFIISVFLFNTLRHPLIIFMGLPMAVIGVTIGLLGSGQPYGFMALLGFLSLSGMLIKNEIVLLDQIELEISEGKKPYKAILDSAVSRVRPVSMAAFTTVFGMIPLIWDPFFAAMAVTIMSGLTFATVLTLVVVPVLYAAFFRVKAEKEIVNEK